MKKQKWTIYYSEDDEISKVKVSKKKIEEMQRKGVKGNIWSYEGVSSNIIVVKEGYGNKIL